MENKTHFIEDSKDEILVQNWFIRPNDVVCPGQLIDVEKKQICLGKSTMQLNASVDPY